MTWREDLRRVTLPDGRKLVGASFRGVPFLVEEDDREGGRRIVVHKFPFRPLPFVEDLDKDEVGFSITGYVVGDDYLAQRDALLTALEDTAGPGTLIHPYYGRKRAICPKVTTRQSASAGGMATFAIRFVETPAQAPTPAIDNDATSKIGNAATAGIAATKAEFAEKFDPLGLPSFALASAQGAIAKASAALLAQLGPVIITTQELATLTAQLEQVTAEAAALVRAPDTIVDKFETAIGGLAATAAAAPGDVVDALIASYGIDLGTPAPTSTATRRREAANQLAITGALRRVIACEAARLSPKVPYASIEEATLARDEIAALLDDQAAGAGDTAYPALVTLRAEVLRGIPGNSVFARIVTVSRRVAVSSIVLAYQLYGNTRQELDLVARNGGISDPGFIVGDVKALSNGGA